MRKRFLILILFLVIIAISNYYFKIDLENAGDFLSSFSLWQAAFIYVLIYVLVNIFVSLAKDILKVIGAIYFGAFLSSACIWAAEVINAVILFSLARYFGRGFVQERLNGRAKAIDEMIGCAGFRGVLLLRLVPLVPYRVLDLLAGLTSLSLIQYFVIAVIGSPLRIFWVQYILAGVGVGVLKNPAALTEYMMANKIVVIWSLVYFILAIVVGVRIKFKKKI
ncbi:MAG: VTT domain-containing protein [Candidatus Omnitrophota bacterium]